MNDIEDQLRRYGEASERHALADEPIMLDTVSRRPARNAFLAVAAGLVVVVAVGVLVVRADDDSARVSIAGPPPTGDAPLLPTIRGTATWTGGPDERGSLRVGACPADDQSPRCPAMRSTDVAADGSFTLGLPADSSSDWKVAAYVTPSIAGCVFTCEWRGAQVGPVTTVAVDQPPATIELTVAARIIDVFVRDSRGEPFAGGGVQVTDLRCTGTPAACRGELAPMFMTASATDGATRLVVDPSISYEFHGQATNTGWPNPAWTNNGSTFWFSPNITRYGRELTEGYVFLVDGAP
jgi:hypothetical protein